MERTGGPAGLPSLAGALNQEKFVRQGFAVTTQVVF
jgi:hypothetical protein